MESTENNIRLAKPTMMILDDDGGNLVFKQQNQFSSTMIDSHHDEQNNITQNRSQLASPVVDGTGDHSSTRSKPTIQPLILNNNKKPHVTFIGSTNLDFDEAPVYSDPIIAIPSEVTLKLDSNSNPLDESNPESNTTTTSRRSTNSLLGSIVGLKFQKLNHWIQTSIPLETVRISEPVSNLDDGKSSLVNMRPMYAATANNITFTYGRGKKARNALNGITIKVMVGTIYAILGPSGCGKTTLVHSLVGSIKPKSGYVKVFGEIPGSARSLVPGPGVGYMPQELGLFEEFTIKETLFFFGRLYRLPKETIRNRISFLISFLELPDKDCFVGKLSGGQKRRVSLASALVHKPPLLVLDEPTVGIDPVLRQSIWRHLRSLTSQDGITVIITTHYIDEAQYANTVAFMRHGTLLEEGNPQELIQRFQLNNLEEVFLALCHNINATKANKQSKNDLNTANMAVNTTPIDNEHCKPLLAKIYDQEQDDNEDDQHKGSPTRTVQSVQNPSPSKQTSTIKQRNVKPSTKKYFAPPPPIMVQQSSGQQRSSSGPTSPPPSTATPHVAHRLLMKRNKILDHFSRSSALLTKNFIRMWRNLPVMLFASLIPVLQCTLFFLCLGRNPYDIPISVYNAELDPAVNTFGPLPKYPFSLELMEQIDNHTITLFNVGTIEQGFETVRSGQAKAFLKFPVNFTKATFEKAMDYMNMDKEMLAESFVDLYLDMSSQFHAMKIKEKIFEAYHQFSRKLLHQNGLDPEVADSPIRIPSPLMGNSNPTVTEFMAPGFIMSLSFFASIATAALTLVLERKDGLLERSLVSGVFPNEYIMSHVITQTVVVIFQIILVLLMAFFIFHIPNRGPVFWISVLIVMQGVAGMAYGILISAIAKEENFTLAACMGSMFPQFLLSGVVWPVDTMPQFLIYVSTFVSQAKAIDAVRYMLYRGWDPFNHWDVALGFIVSATWTVVFLFIATILFNINK